MLFSEFLVFGEELGRDLLIVDGVFGLICVSHEQSLVDLSSTDLHDAHKVWDRDSSGLLLVNDLAEFNNLFDSFVLVERVRSKGRLNWDESSTSK